MLAAQSGGADLHTAHTHLSPAGDGQLGLDAGAAPLRLRPLARHTRPKKSRFFWPVFRKRKARTDPAARAAAAVGDGRRGVAWRRPPGGARALTDVMP